MISGYSARPIVAAIALATTALAANASELTQNLPPELQSLYEGATQTIAKSPYDGFKMPAKPWKWCHSESYQGNPWRVSVTNELKRLVDGLIADGTVASFEVSDSNNDASQQINQIRAFIDKGCSIITSIPGSATALDEAID